MSIFDRFFKKNHIKKPDGKSVCVYCSGDDKTPEEYKQFAFELGKQLGNQGYTLISGGGNNGLMNYINNGHAAAAPNAPRYGVIPKIMRDLNVNHPHIVGNNLIWSEDLYNRIRTFYELCDDIVVLPGGFGTLHELMDSLVLSQFGVIEKRIYLVNIDSFWDSLLAQFQHMVDKQVLYQKHLDHINVVATISELLEALNSERKHDLARGFADEHWKQK